MCVCVLHVNDGWKHLLLTPIYDGCRISYDEYYFALSPLPWAPPAREPCKADQNNKISTLLPGVSAYVRAATARDAKRMWRPSMAAGLLALSSRQFATTIT